MDGLETRFDRFDDDFLKFADIKNPLHKRRDICAFLMLAELVPGTGPIISASEHDEYFLAVDCDKLNEAATDEQIRDLKRCGIRYSSEYDCLAVFA